MAGILLGLAYGNIPIAPPNIKIVFSSNAANVDLRSVILAAGWNGTSVVTVDVTIPAGVVIFSNTVSDYALKVTGSFPAGVVINLVNKGLIVGKGGEGGSSITTEWDNPAYLNGKSGGPAINVTRALTIDNTGGIIAGGGGGGGAGGYGTTEVDGRNITYLGGGGGGGINYGAGGISLNNDPNHPLYTASVGGGNGIFTSAGVGGNGIRDAGSGGNGGGYGAAGSAGQIGKGSYGATHSGGAGGAAGACVVGNANITWTATGSRYGSIS